MHIANLFFLGVNAIKKFLEFDYMEYASDVAAQATYKTNAIAGSYLNSGGTVSIDGDYTVHTFDADGDFVVGMSGDVEYLVVGGGGGGGGQQTGGGGGGGGFRVGSGFAVTAQTYGITVGTGGAGSTSSSAKGTNGEDSIFSSITATGGGGGGSNPSSDNTCTAGADGGCGGGAAGSFQSTYKTGGTGSYGEDGGNTTAGHQYSAGGGGASAAGGNGGSSAAGVGGAGTASTISGASVTYAGGGGGCNESGGDAAAGGAGGGGAGNSTTNATAGTDGTGGGGGGSTGGNGGDGGDGIVIIRCLTTSFSEKPLQSYSESTIKIQGSYSLKGVATINDFTSQYPTQDADHVKATSVLAEPTFGALRATRTDLSLTGDWGFGCWVTGTVTNQRFHIDLDSAKVITRIYYENAHTSGGLTTSGVKSFTFWGSNTAAAFAELTYGTDTNWTQLTTSQATFDQHTGSDVADPKYITVNNTVAYQYYAFKFADNWGHAQYMGLRHVELQSGSGSLNNTLTKTLSNINLSGVARIIYDIRASRTGSNIKLGIHDTGGVTTETTPNILAVNTFERKEWDISAVSDTNKDAIDTFTVTIVNGDAANTFYIDNMRYK